MHHSPPLLRLQQYLPFTVLKHSMPVLICKLLFMLQQYLPFTVLKPCHKSEDYSKCDCKVATVLTVYGIETHVIHNDQVALVSSCNSTYRLRYWNFSAVLISIGSSQYLVATVLTVYGIETLPLDAVLTSKLREVATVLTVYGIETSLRVFTVGIYFFRCNSTYRLRYWNNKSLPLQCLCLIDGSCNSTYRLRYWNNTDSINSA